MANLTLDEFWALPSDKERGQRMKDLSEHDRYVVRITEPVKLHTVMCCYCKHYHWDPSSPRVTCDAFPGGIPRELLSEKVKHTRPYKGDHGIQFERAEEND